jgi:hypothetical protein
MLICFYFLYVSKDWRYLQIPNLTLSILGLIWLSFMPETPRFLFSMNRMDDTRAAFNHIAKTNGKKPLDENVTFYKDAKFSSDALVQNENDDDK